MPSFSEERLSTYTVKQLYDLVIDIENYPKFLPWCLAARILSQNDNIIVAELVIGFKNFTEKYTSKITVKPPDIDNQFASIRVDLLEGPFKHLHNYWEFKSVKEDKTTIYFEIDFMFRSKILDSLISMMFEKALTKMSDAFEQRAREIYG